MGVLRAGVCCVCVCDTVDLSEGVCGTERQLFAVLFPVYDDGAVLSDVQYRAVLLCALGRALFHEVCAGWGSSEICVLDPAGGAVPQVGAAGAACVLDRFLRVEAVAGGGGAGGQRSLFSGKGAGPETCAGAVPVLQEHDIPRGRGHAGQYAARARGARAVCMVCLHAAERSFEGGAESAALASGTAVLRAAESPGGSDRDLFLLPAGGDAHPVLFWRLPASDDPADPAQYQGAERPQESDGRRICGVHPVSAGISAAGGSGRRAAAPLQELAF